MLPQAERKRKKHSYGEEKKETLMGEWQLQTTSPTWNYWASNTVAESERRKTATVRGKKEVRCPREGGKAQKLLLNPEFGRDGEEAMKNPYYSLSSTSWEISKTFLTKGHNRPCSHRERN